MKVLIFTAAALAITSTTADARCPTLSGYPTFERCFLAADGSFDREGLQLQYDIMLAEDLAKIRAAQQRRPPRSVEPVRPRSLRDHPVGDLRGRNRTPPSHRNIEAEMQQRQGDRLQNSFDAARSRNKFRVDQGRARSQDLLYGTQNY